MAKYIDIDSVSDDYMQSFTANAGTYLVVRKILRSVPTADVVEVKHGEWDVNVGMNFNKERICPICKKRIESNYWEFCSHCGAKMDGDK